MMSYKEEEEEGLQWGQLQKRRQNNSRKRLETTTLTSLRSTCSTGMKKRG